MALIEAKALGNRREGGNWQGFSAVSSFAGQSVDVLLIAQQQVQRGICVLQQYNKWSPASDICQILPHDGECLSPEDSGT